jgi:hypothetical protein
VDPWTLFLDPWTLGHLTPRHLDPYLFSRAFQSDQLNGGPSRARPERGTLEPAAASGPLLGPLTPLDPGWPLGPLTPRPLDPWTHDDPWTLAWTLEPEASGPLTRGIWTRGPFLKQVWHDIGVSGMTFESF